MSDKFSPDALLAYADVVRQGDAIYRQQQNDLQDRRAIRTFVDRFRALAALAQNYAPRSISFQRRVLDWLMACFSMQVCRDSAERNHRFLEEDLELVQSLGCTASEAHQLVDYVFGRPAGEPFQELRGVMVTLSALASCHDIDLRPRPSLCAPGP
jgi:hypothetical protein